ncbi:MAG: DUF222 domain-containing protein [Granulosicoccaceae bacterium]
MSANALSATPSSRQSHSVLASSKHQIEIEELDAAIGRLNRQMNVCHYQLMLVLREFDERGGWLKWGFTDALPWLRWRCDLLANAARDKLRVAHALKALPKISDAFERGGLSYSKVRSLTRIADRQNEKELIAMATDVSAANVEAFCRQRVNTTKASTTDANRAYSQRSLRMWQYDSTGIVSFNLELSIEEGELFQKAIEKAAMQLSANTSNTPDVLALENSSWHSLQADAAMQLAREYLDGSGNASNDCNDANSNDRARAGSAADNYQVVVHVDETALVAGKASQANQVGSSQLPIDTVRRLCCDGSIVPIIENAKGEPLSVGRKVRTITTGIRRALWARDKGCAFPGCECKRYVDAHHIKHWADGGETALHNLVLLCTKHHRLLHEGGYSVEHDQLQQRFFRRPDGRVVPECGYRLDDYSENIDIPMGTGVDANVNIVRENSCEFYLASDEGSQCVTAELLSNLSSKRTNNINWTRPGLSPVF